MTLTLPLAIIVLHWIGDFVLQSDWMAKGKSKNNLILLAHVYIYTFFMSVCVATMGLTGSAFKFFAITFVTHFVTDYLTSRWTSKLWFFKPTNIFHKEVELYAPLGGNRHYFFVVIGFDQVIHYVTLALTLRYLQS